MYFRYALLVILMGLFSIISYPASFIVVLFCNKDGWLPKWLTWFQTQDNSCDAGWKIQGNFGTYLIDGTVPTGLTLYWYRALWLIRNNAYGLCYYPLGIAFDSADWTVTHNFTGAESLLIAHDSHGHFCFMYGGSLGELKLGWKVNAYWRNGTWSTTPWGPEMRTSLCFTPKCWRPWRIMSLFNSPAVQVTAP